MISQRLFKDRYRIIWSVLLILVISGCGSFTNNKGKPSSGHSIFVQRTANYTFYGWSKAFRKANSFLEKYYAFGDWKGIDWNALQSEFGARIGAAEETKDKLAYYTALREYVHSLPDGHVKLIGNDLGLRKTNIGGSFGLSLVELDDGRVIVREIIPGYQIDQSGLLWGAEILTWDHHQIAAAIDQSSTLWSTSPIPTQDEIHFQKLNFLARASIGSPVTFSYQNPGDSTVHEVTITAVDDQMDLYAKSLTIGTQTKISSLFTKPVEARILSNGYGYLKINVEFPTFAGLHPVRMVQEAVSRFVAAEVPGVIIDVRSNPGGVDMMAPNMMAYFTQDSMFYERVAHLRESGEFQTVGELILKPASQSYTGPVAMLIDNQTLSTGEGFPLIMKTLNRGPIVGFCGTDGSFGMTGSKIKLPGGYTIAFPNGASFDKNGIIQCDSDSLMQGGIVPNIRVPITEENMRAIYIEGRDVVFETAINTFNKSE